MNLRKIKKMEAKPDISPYSYTWTTEYPNWVLEKEEVDGHSEYFIRNPVANRALLFSSPPLKQAICEEMLKRGCRVVDC